MWFADTTMGNAGDSMNPFSSVLRSAIQQARSDFDSHRTQGLGYVSRLGSYGLMSLELYSSSVRSTVSESLPFLVKMQEILNELRNLGNGTAELVEDFAELLSFARDLGAAAPQYIAAIRKLWKRVSRIIETYSHRLLVLAQELDGLLDRPIVFGFRIIGQHDHIPDGWHEATVEDVVLSDKWKKMTEQWSICLINNGKVDGSGYGYKITHGSFNGEPYVGQRLICRYG